MAKSDGTDWEIYNQVCGPKFTELGKALRESNEKISEIYAVVMDGLKEKVDELKKIIHTLIWIVIAALIGLAVDLIIRLVVM